MATRKLSSLAGVALAPFLAAALPAKALGADLILGSFVDERSAEVAFRIDADSREKIIGGLISLDDRRYRIVGESRHGLIGASRLEGTKLAEENRVGEYLVFSSSFSEQTATGNPWVASNRYVGCETPYNSFVALYRVLGQVNITALGGKPFGSLTEGKVEALDASVYCFMSTRAP